ncbi:MAG: hypothetical protein EBR82_54655 [Caulobacteraceae bacterium]|nr:hypothetical protein [Caulobacteraceae bacterium]
MTSGFASIITGQSTVTATARRLQPIASTIASTSTIVSALSRTAGLATAINGDSSLVAQATLARAIAATVNGQSTVTANLSELQIIVNLAAVTAAQSSVIADIKRLKPVATTIAPVSAITADLQISAALASLTPVTSSLAADLDVGRKIAATIAAQATITALFTDITRSRATLNQQVVTQATVTHKQDGGDTLPEYTLGEVVQLGVNFKRNNADVDPAVVRLKIKTPVGVVTTFVQGVDAGMTKDSVGDYYYQYTPELEGRYAFRWEGTGSNSGAGEDNFDVKESQFN